MSNIKEIAVPVAIGMMLGISYWLGFYMKEWIAEYKCKQETGAYSCSMQVDRSAFTLPKGTRI